MDLSSRLVGNQLVRTRVNWIRVPVFAVILLGLELGVVWAQSRPSDQLDEKRVAALLQSRRVLELRDAVAILRGHPGQAMEFLPAVSRRANHPELTSLFEEMVNRADEDILKSLLGSADLQQRAIVETRLNRGAVIRPAASASLPSSGTSASGGRSFPDGRAVPGGLEMNRGMAPGGIAAPMPSRSGQPGSTLNQPLPGAPPSPGTGGGRNLMMEGFPGQSIEQQLIMMMSRPELTKEQTEAVYELLDDDYSGHPKKAWVLHMGSRVLSRHVLRDPQDVYDHFLNAKTRHPERLVSLVSRRFPRPPEVDEKIWLLAQSEDPDVRKIALQHFVAPKEKANEYAMTMMRWVTEDPERRSELSSAIARCTINLSDQGRLNVFQWFLGGIESEEGSAESQGAPPHLLRSTSGAVQVASRLRAEDQKLVLPIVLQQARFSKHSMQYVKIIDSFRCDRSEAVSDLRAMMLIANDHYQRLYLGNCLYRCAGHDDAVFKLCRDTLYQEPVDWKLVNLALAGMKASGPRAKDHVGRMLVLFEKSTSNSSRIAIINLLAAIGPDAANATGMLVKAFPETTQGYERSIIIKAFGAFGSQAKEAVPLLLEQVQAKDHQARRESVSALAKIAPDDVQLREKLLALIGKDRSLQMHLEREWKKAE